MMQVRLAQPSDAPTIAAIYAPYVTDSAISFETEPPDAAEMARRMQANWPRHAWLVAEARDGSGAVQGYAYSGPHRSRAAYQWGCEVSAYVRSDVHGRGVGRALYGVLIELLIGQGYTKAYGGIVLPNAASIALHEAMGFQHFATYDRVGFKSGTWHDVGWWQRDLAPSAAAPEVIRPVTDVFEA